MQPSSAAASGDGRVGSGCGGGRMNCSGRVFSREDFSRKILGGGGEVCRGGKEV